MYTSLYNLYMYTVQCVMKYMYMCACMLAGNIFNTFMTNIYNVHIHVHVHVCRKYFCQPGLAS